MNLNLLFLGYFITQIPPLTARSTHIPYPPLPYQVLHEFSDPTWVENLAVRTNGQLLLNILTAPEMYLLDPVVSGVPDLIFTFPEALGLGGIVELQTDIFYVNTGNFTLQTGSVNGSAIVWRVDMRQVGRGDLNKVVVEKVVEMPEALTLNGMDVLSRTESGGILLIADSGLGVLWKLDVTTKEYSTILALPEMKSPPPPSLQNGLDGIRVRDGFLYFTNNEGDTFSRVLIDTQGHAVGPTQSIAFPFGDDFAFDSKGNIWVTSDQGDRVIVLEAGRAYVNATVEGSSTQLTAVAGVTACKFGRSVATMHLLYASTNGGLSNPINGTLTEGGQVLAIDTSSFKFEEMDRTRM
ncbi:hypothetical protein D0Z07_9233 [Hyphodiscus hymeniophilus]|uniref:SMP-30/Gluconolactonase/LRE-like region domain-containing protein n=1 Tax=Hyphodiscus hymeniophilus TaxID=353542 RepID=A0A9P6VD54_9HELO|nr:hypothetical protein D0Z07_9233 [Hyphodiscus hymeniophilus]